jgi:colicin import membrane protein
MARKLKTYQTSQGFLDLAIAAPSMKAVLQAWGANSNLFHQGFAREVADSRVVAATMKKPGVVLKRPVGSNGPYTEHADLPTGLPAEASRSRPVKPAKPPKKTKSRAIDDRTASKAALVFEKEQRRREIARRKAEAMEAKKRKRRDQVVAKAEAVLEAARHEQDARVSAIEAERDKLEQRASREDNRWEKLKKRLETALRRAKS